MELDNIISYINLAGMLIAPVGFFFWVKFKIGQTDEALVELKLSIKEENIQIKASKNAMKRELEARLKEYKEDQAGINAELKTLIEGLRGDINTTKSEVLAAINNLNR